MYDVVVAGGSVAGLLCAREIAAAGFSVLVIEANYEIGTPEHCGGLVSSAGLEELGVIPFKRTFGHAITSAVFTSPDGQKFAIDADRHNVVEINRRELDKQIAVQAQKNGAEIRVRTSLQKITDTGIKTKDQEIASKIVVDARGVTSIIQQHQDKRGILASAQYEICSDWIRKGEIQVIFDQNKSPGFFSWVIPTENNRGKVGVAGMGINAAATLDDIITRMGGGSTLRKIFAPIWVKGPVKNFVQGRTVVVGDAAGQSKPTTAGGIYTCGMGGILAGKAISSFLKTGEKRHLATYQKEWTSRFGREFEKQIIARNILEDLDNKAINSLFKSVTPKIIKEIEEKDNFDFHVSAIVRLLGAGRLLKMFLAVTESKCRQIQARYK